MRFFSAFLVCLPLLAEPRLLLDRRDIERIQKQAGSDAWAASVRDAILHRAEEWPADHVHEFGLKEWALPQEGAGWSHSYVCPEHGVRLKQSAGRNLCPIDGKDYHGWPVDNVVYMQRNGDNARALGDLGLAWQLSGRQEFVDKARRMLCAYAELYPKLPIHDNYNKPNTKSGARVMSQTLSEAGWLIPLVFGYDLVRDAVPAAERTRFETDVLRNAAQVISRYDAGRSNWQSYHNAALLAVGLEVNDPALVKLALDGPGGFKFQMRESITPDGPWFEGAWGYHFFALRPLLETREMALRAGIALPEADALKRMLDAPLLCVFPDGSLPDFNDSGLSSIGRSAYLYDIGYRIFHDPRYVPVIRSDKRGLEALLWGAESLPAGETVAPASGLMPAAGVATLRVAGSDSMLAIKFGPHGGGHGHFDKLSFVSFANGEQQAADPGTQAYAAPTHSTWDKMSVAHNTVTVDEKTQAAATGQLLEWAVRPEAAAIRMSAGAAYPDAELERTIVHTAGYTLDIFDVRASDGKAHAIDWLYHNYGRAATPLRLADYTSLPQVSGYQHLAHARGAATAEAWQADFAQAKSKLRVRMLGAPGRTVVMGEGLGPDLRVPVPFVMVRANTGQTRFAALYEPYVAAPSITGFREVRPNVYAVETAAGTDEISVEPGHIAIVRRIGEQTTRWDLAGTRP